MILSLPSLEHLNARKHEPQSALHSVCHPVFIYDESNAALSQTSLGLLSELCQDAATLCCFLKRPLSSPDYFLWQLNFHHFVFNLRSRKGAPRNPLGVQIGLFRLSDPSWNPRAHLICLNVVSGLVCFLQAQGFALLILSRVWDSLNTSSTHLHLLPLEIT